MRDDDAAHLGAGQLAHDAPRPAARQMAKSMSLLSSWATCSLSIATPGRRGQAIDERADADSAAEV